mmetsp:Transcript_56176/g.159916  ORF Transcript_56176/g.159916 Transcript_56176/m.159916 type:complete len:240 (-) Transcript_56176:337-1056(-)
MDTFETGAESDQVGVYCSSPYSLADSSDLELDTTDRTPSTSSRGFPWRYCKYRNRVALLGCCLMLLSFAWHAMRGVRTRWAYGAKEGLVTSGAIIREPEFGAIPSLNGSDCQTFFVRNFELNGWMGSYGDSTTRTQVAVQCNRWREHLYVSFHHVEISIGSDMGSYHFYSGHYTWRNSDQVAKLYNRPAPHAGTQVGLQCDSLMSGCTVTFDLTICCIGGVQTSRVPPAWVLVGRRPMV